MSHKVIKVIKTAIHTGNPYEHDGTVTPHQIYDSDT
jgi:hypothetical protein